MVRIAKKSDSKKKTSPKKAKSTKKPVKKQAKPAKKQKKPVKKQAKPAKKQTKPSKKQAKPKKSLKKDVKKAEKSVKETKKSKDAVKVFKKSKEEFNLETHFLVPKHTKLSEKEKAELLETYNITLEELPRISIADPAIAHIKDLTKQDVIKIERPSETANKALFYRRVAK